VASSKIAALFPLKWMCQGLRSVFLPPTLLPAKPAHFWQRGWVALVLISWAAAGMLGNGRALRFAQAGQAGHPGPNR
jgi:ABC-2 type transport system permease protein